MADPWESPSSSSDLYRNGAPGVARGDFPLATFAQRALAWFIDVVIMATISEVLVKINARSANTLSALVDIGYMVLLLGGPFGQTIGAKVAKVRVINLDGKRLGYLRAAIRYFVSGISAIVLALGYLWMLRDKKAQTWHDKVAGSLVISVAGKPGPHSGSRGSHDGFPFSGNR